MMKDSFPFLQFRKSFPKRQNASGHTLVLHAPDNETQRQWLAELNRTIQMLQEEDLN